MGPGPGMMYGSCSGSMHDMGRSKAVKIRLSARASQHANSPSHVVVGLPDSMYITA
jgi:hypothetical protein